MSKKTYLTVAVIFLALALTGYTLFSQQLKTIQKKNCCIAGKYKGFHKDNPSRTCGSPDSGKFIMVINQARGCGEDIWGTITSADGTVQKFKGKVAYSARGCCKIRGVIRQERRIATRFVMKKPVRPVIEQTVFDGLICKKKGKWVVEKGTYNSAEGCTGTFTLQQQ